MSRITSFLVGISAASLFAWGYLLYHAPIPLGPLLEHAQAPEPSPPPAPYETVHPEPQEGRPHPSPVMPEETRASQVAPVPSVPPGDARTLALLEIAGPGIERSYPIRTKDIPLIEAMQRARSEGLSFSSRDYPGMGAFVESIGGVPNADGYYWILWKNGAKAAAGASSMIVHEGDQFRWVYEQGY